jgi:hypothetical protein
VTSTFRDMIQRVSPGWLLGAPSVNGTLDHIGQRYLYAIGLHIDRLGDAITVGVKKRYPTYIEPGFAAPDDDALALIGRDRTIPRGPAESGAAYATRLTEWIDDLKMSGNAFETLRQIQGYLTPNHTTLRLVNNWGIWYTLNPDYSTALTISPLVAGVPNWNWDNAGPWQQTWSPLWAWSRFWVIIYCNGGLPFDNGRKWGDGTKWGSGWTWGTTATKQQVADIRAIIGTPNGGFKSAHSKCMKIIIAFDPTSFNPASPGGSPLPDGTWGRWAHPVGSPFSGQQARLPTARYWDGPP